MHEASMKGTNDSACKKLARWDNRIQDYWAVSTYSRYNSRQSPYLYFLPAIHAITNTHLDPRRLDPALPCTPVKPGL